MIKQIATDLCAPTIVPPVDLDYWYGRGEQFSFSPLDEAYAPPADGFPNDEAEQYYGEGYLNAQGRSIQCEY